MAAGYRDTLRRYVPSSTAQPSDGMAGFDNLLRACPSGPCSEGRVGLRVESSCEFFGGGDGFVVRSGTPADDKGSKG